MADKARTTSTNAAKVTHASKARPLARILGACVIGCGGLAAVAVAAWGAGWGSNPDQLALRPTLPAPMSMEAEPFAIAAPVRTVVDIQNFHTSGIIALAPNWLFDPALQEARKPVQGPQMAALPLPEDAAPSTAQPPRVETATVVPLPVANPLFAGRLQAPGADGTDEAAAQSAEATRQQLAMAPLPPRNPLMSVQTAATSGPLPEDEPDEVAPVAPEPPPPEATRPELDYPRAGDRFALYDIKAKKVYLPNGTKLEAHSGYGDKMDDIRHVAVKMYGPTPPNVYKLTWREQLFHGVKAVRMTPIGGNAMYNRNGFLVHSYLLGPRGDSNGCISIDDYDTFRDAFAKGQFDRVVVVESMPKGDSPGNPLIAWLTGKGKK